ncbi:MAG: T9SS type A sorting domain-containing protein [Flavobacteriales bacterium]|nr:T9SS type A sorting domain-containing protein [Flavobacteriales bacterium]
MKRLLPRWTYLLLGGLLSLVQSNISAQFSYGTIGSTYTQDFTSLGTASITIAGGDLGAFNAGVTGWYFSETGTAANTTMTAGTGSSATGDSYHFGPAASTERAIGGLFSGSLTPRFGFYLTNNTGQTISSLQIAYTGETWRIGATGRFDKLDFQYSTDATSLTTGTWTDVDNLDYANVAAVSTGSGSMLQSAPIGFTITGLSIANGTTVFLRWNDFNATGSDDGMAVDDFSLIGTAAASIVVDETGFTGAFGNEIVGNSTTSSSFTVSGTNLTNPLLVTPPTGFEIRTGVDPFSTSAIDLGSGNVAVTTIDVRFTPLAGIAYSDNVVCSSSPATTQNVAVSGTGIAPAAPTQLVITSINGGNNVVENLPFSITVEAQDGGNIAQNVSANTGVQVNLITGFGNLGGTVTGTILAGTNNVVISGITYDLADFGVEVEAARTSGDVLTSGTSAPFDVLGAAQDLGFANVPISGVVGVNLAAFQVQALRGDASVADEFAGLVTISIQSGPGNIAGTLAVNALNGIATFNDINFDAPGGYILQAVASGLNPGNSPSIPITNMPTMTELVVPRYMGSKSASSTNANRTPFALCVQFDNLVPNTLYDVRAGLGLTSDAATTYGAGNVWNGTTYGTSNLSGTFTSDGSGSSGPYWLFVQPTGNGTRFDGGQVHNLRISTMINGNPSPSSPQFISAKTITALDIATTARTPATTDDGAYVHGSAGVCLTGKFILVYDNVAGTGDPLSSFQAMTTTPSDNTVGSYSGHPTSIGDIYKQNGTSVIGDYPAVVPIGANNTNGVRRIEAREQDNSIFGAITDADGNWPGGADFTTIARRGVGSIGIADPLFLPDADLDGVCDDEDNCPADANPAQTDTDLDGLGDACDVCPTIFNGTPGDACDDGNPNTVYDILGAAPACGCAGTPCTETVTIETGTDGGGYRWTLRSSLNNAIVQSSTGYPAYESPLASPDYTETTCLPDGEFYFVFEDEDCNGIANGGYIVRVSGKRVIDNRNNINNGCTSEVAGNTGVNVPVGNDRLISASCDRLELRRGVNANCSDRLTADDTPNGTSGNVYQFWIYEPNGGLSIRYPANGPGSNQVSMANLPSLVSGTMYNVRVRTRISPGVWRAWGSACRMKIDNMLGQCGAAGLVDDPSNANHSCGKTVTLPPNNSSSAANRVVCMPVTRYNNNCVNAQANKYQFRFRLPAENVVIVRNSNTNFTHMFTSSGFETCKTYEVEVRASFDGGATWCRGGVDPINDLTPWGPVCEVYTGGCDEEIVGNTRVAADAGTTHLYPNPNRGDHLFLNLDAIEEGVNTVSVDIYDTFGKRVSTRTLAVQDGFINTVLELNGELATGLYMVHVTAGDAVYTERLVIQP